MRAVGCGRGTLGIVLETGGTGYAWSDVARMILLVKAVVVRSSSAHLPLRLDVNEHPK